MSIILKNAKVLDLDLELVQEVALEIHGDRVVRIFDSEISNFSGEIYDLEGRWVLPGLNDMHVHSYGNQSPKGEVQLLGISGVAQAMLYAGTTGFLDLANRENSILGFRDRQRREGFLGADIYAAGSIFTCENGHGTEYGFSARIVNTPREARESVARLAKKRPDVVKLVYNPGSSHFPSMDKPTMNALVGEAKAHGLKSVVHIESWDGVRDVLEVNVEAITHSVYEPVPDDLLGLMARKGTFVIPTLTVHSELATIVDNPTLLEDPLLSALTTPSLLKEYRAPSEFNEVVQAWLSIQRAEKEGYFRNLSSLVKNGIRIMAGTDAGNMGVFQGYSIHREIMLLVEGGCTPWQALAAATTVPGSFLGEIFCIQPGALANLVVLNSSPIEDITNTRDIAEVIYHGRIVDRQRLISLDKFSAQHVRVLSFRERLLDDFSNGNLISSSGVAWQKNSDLVLGGQSTISCSYSGATLRVEGHVKPSSQRPGFAGLTLLLDERELPFDVTGFEGLSLRGNMIRGHLFLKLITPRITNFDYHAVPLPTTKHFREFKFPFSNFRQLWSEPIPWNGHDMVGVSLMVTGFSPLDYAFELDEIGFY